MTGFAFNRVGSVCGQLIGMYWSDLPTATRIVPKAVYRLVTF